MRIEFAMSRLTDHILGLYLQYTAEIFGNANGTFGEWLSNRLSDVVMRNFPANQRIDAPSAWHLSPDFRFENRR